ncbi:MAG: hypothetical protein ACYDEY_15725 [Acidimicrobiales bacterium]
MATDQSENNGPPTAPTGVGDLSPRDRVRLSRWFTALPFPFPWGPGIAEMPSSLELLLQPLAFTQSDLLSPVEFIKEAGKRGVRLQLGQLHELHRIGALVPFFRVLARPVGPRRPDLPEAVTSREMGGCMRMVLQAYRLGHLVDPATRPYRQWGEGLRIERYGITDHLPSVFYGEHQLLGLRQLRAACSRMQVTHNGNDAASFHVEELDPLTRAGFAHGRALSMVLHAIDSHFLPHIVGIAVQGHLWAKLNPSFSTRAALKALGTSPEEVFMAADNLLSNAHAIDPLGPLYELVRYAQPDVWKDLKGDARLAMDMRTAAEVLLRGLEDIGRADLATLPPREGRMVWDTLDDRIPANSTGLDQALTSRGLSPYPSVILALEGKTEMMLMPGVLDTVFKRPVPSTMVEPVVMGGIDQKFDLLVRHAIALRLDRDIGDVALLERPPTRLLVAVDPEHAYKTPTAQEAERKKLVGKIFEVLPTGCQTPAARAALDALVTVTTWESGPWEFANFTDGELTTAIMRVTRLPSDVTRALVMAQVKKQRRAKRPNVEAVTAPWGVNVNKVELARETEPVLRQKVRAHVRGGTLKKLPAGRVAEQALGMAMASRRRQVGIRVK